MQDAMQMSGPHRDFESIKKIDENGIEYWEARRLGPLLGYQTWENFVNVIKKAQQSSLNSGQPVENHFRDITKMVEIGYGNVRRVVDWKLSRYACYLIAQNGDASKPEIAVAQTYFATQTRRQEIFESLSAAEKRVFIRGEVTNENKKLFSTARQAGVSQFGLFNDAGYKGLYGSSLGEIERKKGIEKGELLDRAGSTELAANLFRITQTDEKLKKDNVRGEYAARQTHFMVGGKVRKTIKEIGGELPENMKPERHIKEIKRDIKLVEKQNKKLLEGSKSKR